ncbi:MAG: class I SAM-dependent methyltransferase, partial [Streptococcaceae bacterium]|nr:class I SAM-dependent methyltransferase [Streptococcaceae bacterium]
SENQTVLDVGSGTGRLLRLLENQNPQFIGFGVDISEGMVEEARKNFPQFKFQKANAELLPFEDGKFDKIICSASFHHFPHPEDFLREANRVLKPGGELVIAEIHFPKFILPMLNWYILKFNSEGDVRVYAPNEIVTLLRKNGFLVKTPSYFLQVQLHCGFRE